MKKKRILAVLLVVVLLMGLFNATGFAADEGKGTDPLPSAEPSADPLQSAEQSAEPSADPNKGSQTDDLQKNASQQSIESASSTQYFKVKNENPSNTGSRLTVTYNSGPNQQVQTITGGQTKTFTYVPRVTKIYVEFSRDGYDFDKAKYNKNNGNYQSINTNPWTSGTGVVTPNDTIYINTDWKVKQYQITTSVENGSINPPNPMVNHGGQKTISYSPDANCILKSVTVDGQLVDISTHPTSYKFTNVTSTHTISVVFEKKKYDINFIAGENGSLSGTDSYNITHGDAFPDAPEPVPNDWYTFDKWDPVLLTGSEVTGPGTYTALFKEKNYSVTYDANGGTGDVPTDDSDYNKTNKTVTVKSADGLAKVGYKFDGWTKNADGTGAVGDQFDIEHADVTLYAKWVPISYTVVYYKNGGSGWIPNSTHSYDTTKALNKNKFYKNGYTFIGWKINDEGRLFADEEDVENLTTVDSDTVKLYAQWSATEYVIGYELYGGTNHADNPSTYTINDRVKLKYPTMLGYTFLGWTGTDLPWWQPTKDVSFKGQTGPRKYYANWRLDKYNITYDLDGGKVLPPNPTIYDVHTTTFKLNNPTKRGYTFVGWKEGDNAPVLDVVIGKGSTGHRHYKAIWEANTYTVIYNSNGGTGDMEASQFTYGDEEKALRLNSFSRKGYQFVGWKSKSGVDYEDGALVKNLTSQQNGKYNLYAQWELLTYNIEYRLGGADDPGNPAQYSVRSKTFTLKNPAMPGYTFLGWSGPDIKGLSKNVTIEKGSIGHRKYTAHWIINVYLIGYDLNGGMLTKFNPISYTVNSKDIKLNNPIKVGHTFAGWTGTDLEEATLEVIIPKGSTGHRCYKATWTVNQYDVMFVSNGGSEVLDQSVDYGEKIEEPEKPIKAGHTFVGWYKDSALTKAWDFDKYTMPAKSITLYAKWNANSYTVTYEPNGGTGTTVDSNHVYGVLSPLTQNGFAREGHVFLGWSKTADGEVEFFDGASVSTLAESGAIPLYAQWLINKYTVIFVDFDGLEISKCDVDHGKGVTAPASPTRKGYTFTGWSAKFDAVTSNMTVTAQYSINQYKVTFESNGGTAVAAATVPYDTLVTQPTAPTKQYHSFKGWFKDAALTTAWNFAAEKIGAADMTLYAKWEADPITNLKSKETMYVGGRKSWSPQPPNGTWSWDPAYLTRLDDGQFKALKVGVTNVVYKANGLTHTIEVTILKAKLPVTGQQSLWIWILGGLGLCAAAGAGVLFLRKRQHGTSEE